MIIEQYGVKLKRLEIGDIEIVRKWRNHTEIKRTMNFQKYITRQMQLDWFNSINNKYNYYFLIIYDQIPIGMINAKDISLNEFTGEGGIFIGEKKKEYELISVYASLSLLNVVFKVLNYFEKSVIQVRKDNPKAISYNSLLGYNINKEKSTDEIYFFELTREGYFSHTERLNKTAQKLTGDFAEPRIKGIYSDDLFLEVFKKVLKVN
ncbi:MAG: hypothetical protein J0G96_14970 [Flavobacteriia bacterium]|nr:hypothetical protein [Flavobacteriia bacterium]OJX35015.1 MAG: hypothetical protein BGO87_09780 [Flavobacteriia bacterium 40-80]